MGMLAGIPANEGMLNAIHSLRVPPVENNNVETMKRGSSPSPEESGEKRSEAHIETPSKHKKPTSTGITQWQDGPKEYFV
jgi:hypothetical protein